MACPGSDTDRPNDAQPTADSADLGSGLVHGRLAHWATVCPDRPALTNSEQSLGFLGLHRAVQAQAAELEQAHAPSTVWVDTHAGVIASVVRLLGIIASGRCAAVADPDWPDTVRAAVQAHLPPAPHTGTLATPLAPFYIGFTSGSTGLPKGFQRHHHSWVSSFEACVDTFGDDARSTLLAPGRPSHSLFLFGMLLGLWTGGGSVVQDRFSAAQALATLQLGQTPCLMAVPSQLLMLLALARRRALPPVTGVRLILISGARWMRNRTPELRQLFPQARVVEFYGASETSFMTWMDADPQVPPMVVGQAFAQVDIDIRRPAGEQGPGLIYVRSPMLFSTYVGVGDEQTAALRDGDWLSVRDMGHWDAEGRLCLIGRQNRMLVTQGKNLFPEEIEAVLLRHPHVQQASVLGVPDPVRGQRVVALLHTTEGSNGLDSASLVQWCRPHLEAYKVPRQFWRCTDWPLTVSGKTDHAALARALNAPHTDTPCLHPMS